MNKASNVLKDLFMKLVENKNKIVFIVLFSLVCFLFNLNIESINVLLNRGTVLEYSYSKNTQIETDKIHDELIKLGLNYFLIEVNNDKNFKKYDFENKIVDKNFYIVLPYIAKEDKKELIDSVSKYVFDNFKQTKLIDIKTLNDNYSKPYSGLIKFLIVFFISYILWILYMKIFEKENVLLSIKNNIKEFYQNEIQNDLFSGIKKEGIGFLFKYLLLDKKARDNSKDDTSALTKEVTFTILFVLVCVILIRYFIGELRWIPSGSMIPTFLVGDRVYVEKIYDKKDIKRGDILVFYPPFVQLSNSPFAIMARLTGIFCKDIAYIKRVVALPGDKFEVKFDKNLNKYYLNINNKPLYEPYTASDFDWSACDGERAKYCGPFVVPQDNYFMMGDNRGNSEDSRFWGFLPQDRIIGRATFLFFPFKRLNLLNDDYMELYKEKTGEDYAKNVYIINRY